MLKQYSRKIIFLACAILLCAFADAQKQAREKLGVMNIEYSEESFLKSIKNNDIYTVELFLKSGMSPNKATISKNELGIDETDWSALGLAVKSGNYDLIELLLNNGADINFDTDRSKSALTTAVMAGNLKMTKYLTDKGADLHLSERTKNGLDLLSLGTAFPYLNNGSQNIDVLEFLISKGLSPNYKNSNSSTPLLNAINFATDESAKLFISCGAKITSSAIQFAKKQLSKASYKDRKQKLQIIVSLLESPSKAGKCPTGE